MEVPDICFLWNRDWDPYYFGEIFQHDFYDYSDMWSNDIGDTELLESVNKIKTYCPVVEDISFDDNELCQAVEWIEEE